MKDIKDVPWLPNGALPGGIYLMGPLIEKPDVRGPVAEVVMGGRTYYIRHTGSSLSPSQREELEKWVAKRIGLKPAEILVQAIIDPYHTTSEGQLIRALSVPWKMIVKELQNDWSLAFKISPRTWEEMIAAAFNQAGYDEVTLTPRSGDHGRDVIAVRNGVGAIRIVDSVKAYKPGHLVRYDDVRALSGVLHGDPKASKGILTTTSEFAPGISKDPFIAPLIPYRLELMDGTRLNSWLNEVAERS